MIDNKGDILPPRFYPEFTPVESGVFGRSVACGRQTRYRGCGYVMLSPKQIRFVQEYCVDFNATSAYIRAGYSESGAGQSAHVLLKNPEVQAAVEREQAALAAVAMTTRGFVVRELLSVATSDRPAACRHCYGIEHKRQWTEREYSRALDRALKTHTAVPDLEGGLGYLKSCEPFPDCPECGGDGIPPAKEIKTPDKLKAIEMLGRYLGMFTDKSEISGPGGGPVQLQAVRPEDLSDDQLAAIAAAGVATLGVSGGVSSLALPAGQTIEGTCEPVGLPE